MNVLTWHGAVLRVDGIRQKLAQDPVWMTAADGADFVFAEQAQSGSGSPLDALELLPGSRAGTVRLSNPAGLLTANPSKRDMIFEPDDGSVLQSFMLIEPDDLADLRHILAHRWRVRPGNQFLEKADIKLVAGFGLELGSLLVDLSAGLPLASFTRSPAGADGYQPPPSFILQPGDELAESIELADFVPQKAAASQFPLAGNRAVRAAEAETRDIFRETSSARLTIAAAAPRFVGAPLVVRARDAELFVQWLEMQPAPAIGHIRESWQIRREQRRYVVLSGGCAGLVFDEEGTSADIMALATLPRLPEGLCYRDGQVWVEREVLRNAPRLEGPLVVFYEGALDSYTRWLAGAMPSLDVLSRVMPSESRLLLPAGLGRAGRGATPFEHREVMAAMGFGDLPVVEDGADIVWVDNLIFAERAVPAAVPAEQLRAFREHALHEAGGFGEASKRIYIRHEQAGSLAKGHTIEGFLAGQGFETVQLDEMPLGRQIALFREAEFLVASHGGGLSNMIFAPPGLRVLELAEGTRFRPDFWALAGKLGHVHGFVGCPSRGHEGQMRLLPDVDAFTGLFALLDGFGR